jgi:hypothetical protein
MVVKSSANENKVFAMTVTKPSTKLGKCGRGARFAWKSGRGDVAWQHRGLWSLSPEFKSRPRPHQVFVTLQLELQKTQKYLHLVMVQNN